MVSSGVKPGVDGGIGRGEGMGGMSGLVGLTNL